MNKYSVEKLNAIVDGFVKESEVDYVGLWEISKVAREELDARTLQDVREIGLRIVKGLYEQGLRPGDYDYAQHMDFWPDIWVARRYLIGSNGNGLSSTPIPPTSILFARSFGRRVEPHAARLLPAAC